MTEDALRRGAASAGQPDRARSGHIPGRPAPSACPGLSRRAEGDWSNAAFFLCAGRLVPWRGVTVHGPGPPRLPGDRAVSEPAAPPSARECPRSGRRRHRPARDDSEGRRRRRRPHPRPDPGPRASLAAAAEGDTQHRQRPPPPCDKESDRLKGTAALLPALGGSVEEQESGLFIHGTGRPAGRHCRCPGATTASPWPPPCACACRGARSRVHGQPLRCQVLPPLLGGPPRS